ncbi:hypothetical protein HYH02_008885 [Chlamydomonas schloesseri]|uniref:Uncharacterized protein n=1 Tax=Chlamydomonas schloesseri TaxID=2026947 RepID=A0A835WCT2_9CHLO|nr:hypothetical protein HYH02_008885 [Chlamydomonas schloesseri]|eukprot:KAG2445017.1 hypothetical protein HYH02_008885 [Chlamydomonas schloesseri]
MATADGTSSPAPPETASPTARSRPLRGLGHGGARAERDSKLTADDLWRQLWGFPVLSDLSDDTGRPGSAMISGAPVQLNMVDADGSDREEEQRPLVKRRPQLSTQPAHTTPVMLAAPTPPDQGSRPTASAPLNVASPPPPPYPGTGHPMAPPGPWLRPGRLSGGGGGLTGAYPAAAAAAAGGMATTATGGAAATAAEGAAAAAAATAAGEAVATAGAFVAPSPKRRQAAAAAAAVRKAVAAAPTPTSVAARPSATAAAMAARAEVTPNKQSPFMAPPPRAPHTVVPAGAGTSVTASAGAGASGSNTEERNWSGFVHRVIYSYRITPQSSTGASPALCLYGRELTTAAERPVPAAAGEEAGGSGGPAAPPQPAASDGPSTDEEAFTAEPQQLEARHRLLEELTGRVQQRLEKAQEKQVRDHERRNIKSAPPRPRSTKLPPSPIAAVAGATAGARRDSAKVVNNGAYGADSEEEARTRTPSGSDTDGGKPKAAEGPAWTPAGRAQPPTSGRQPTVEVSPRGGSGNPGGNSGGVEHGAWSPLKTRRQRQQQSGPNTLEPGGLKAAAQAAHQALSHLPPAPPKPRTPGPKARAGSPAYTAAAKVSDYEARLAALPDLQVGDEVYRRRRPRNKLESDREGPYAFQAFHHLLTHILVRDQNGLEFSVPLHDVFVPKHRQ